MIDSRLVKTPELDTWLQATKPTKLSEKDREALRKFFERHSSSSR